MNGILKKSVLVSMALALMFVMAAGPAMADMNAAKKWVDEEFQTLDPVQKTTTRRDAMVHRRRQAI